MFAAWGRITYRFRWWMLVASAISLALAVFAMGHGGTLGSSDFGTNTEAGRGFDLMQKQLPQNPPSFTLIFSSSRLHVTDPAFRTEMQKALKPIEGNPNVISIRTPFDASPADARQLVSKDGQRALAVVQLKDAGFGSLKKTYRDLRTQVHSRELSITPAGALAINSDFDKVAESDLRRAETISLPIALLLLLLVFGSLVAAGVPLGVGALAVVGGLAGTLLLARFITVSVYAQNIVTMIGLGVAIDYSLFIVSRFREEVRHRPVDEAVMMSVATAGRAVMFSGITVAIGLLGMTFFRLRDLAPMGYAGTIVVALAVIYALTFLPALLGILGPRVNALRIPFIHPERESAGHGLWHRLATTMMAHPWRVLVPTVLVLLLLGYPVVHIKLGWGDYTVLPRSAKSRQGAELLAKEFPGGDTNQIPVIVKFEDGQPLSADHVAQLYQMGRWLSGLPRVTRVDSPVTIALSISLEQYQAMYSQPSSQLQPQIQALLQHTVGKDIVVLLAYTPYSSASDQAHELVRTIRDSHPQMSGKVIVTGETAWDIDSVQSVKDDAPKAIAFIIIATYIVLFLLLGSVLLPLKAVLMNFLSISASYGALVWIFQEGHLSGLLNFTPGPISTITPVLMFCILFGLSMDYEVLLLSRVKEEYERTGDNTHAVAYSLERTGRLITGAAAIMASVFLSFVAADTVVIKATGLGMGIAVIADATIIRAMLVPATMRLLGRWNWWAPKPLARLYSRLGLREAAHYEPVGAQR